jgi:isocitrate dehydrogenase
MLLDRCVVAVASFSSSSSSSFNSPSAARRGFASSSSKGSEWAQEETMMMKKRRSAAKRFSSRGDIKSGRKMSSSSSARSYASSSSSSDQKLVAAPMVYVAGEEMTKYVMDLVKEKWIAPHVDTSKWEHFDLSAKNRDDTNDQVLKDVVAAGFKLKAIFKEPTITPTADQVKRLGLKKTWGSPNGAMRRGWNGITISRDTIHIDGIELGYKSPVLFERHAVGGEYAAGWKNVGRGTLKTTFVPKDGPDAGKEIVVDERECKDEISAVVTYDNAYDNVHNLAKFFFE